MFKRLIYVLYIGALFFGFLFGIMGLFGGRTDAVVTAGFLAVAAYLLRHFGIRRFDFPRLAKSFPMGVPADALSKEKRVEFERLVKAFRASENWTERQAMRGEMAALVKSEPLLVDEFARDIAEVHPHLYYGSLQQTGQ